MLDREEVNPSRLIPQESATGANGLVNGVAPLAALGFLRQQCVVAWIA